jgi:hypothetical protein
MKLSKQVWGTLIATVIEKIYLFFQNLFVEICSQFVDSVNCLKHHIILHLTVHCTVDIKYPGLFYSVSCDGAFCLHCVLVCKEPSKHGQLGSEPFRNWKKATEKFDEHFWKKRHNSGDTSVKKRPSSDYESLLGAFIKVFL